MYRLRMNIPTTHIKFTEKDYCQNCGLKEQFWRQIPTCIAGPEEEEKEEEKEED